MNFLIKLFKTFTEAKRNQEIKKQPVYLSLDDSFVHNFINKGGKFLYCTKIEEVKTHLNHVLVENNWKRILCSDLDLLKLLKKIDVNTQSQFSNNIPFFTTCEHLIADKGDILFSSNQLGSNKLPSFSENFIVYATTSQIVKNTSEGLTGIKTHFSGNIPTNISAIKNYSIKNSDDNFMDYGNTNSKNLYLLLFEDL
ncbi:hypothetical protein C7447_10720 [Tenacibaculum adriaticum]|uniref:LUD domain-containing protein n=1 Tax=Tenacibaculum adriaticum TaxID=413713 RepID=A0A5S5DLD8_9FLAO|nr:hypothetical protein [Tenacibaculum adriaticum]TYP96454.1 hypothetical protein C7447_10720 [Tenacibaculum adriaticum]